MAPQKDMTPWFLPVGVGLFLFYSHMNSCKAPATGPQPSREVKAKEVQIQSLLKVLTRLQSEGAKGGQRRTEEHQEQGDEDAEFEAWETVESAKWQLESITARNTIEAMEKEIRTLKKQLVGGGASGSGASSGSGAPMPPTLDEAMKMIKQTPECLRQLKRGYRKSSFTSQYTQDYFMWVNFFHTVPLGKGFYLDIGANEPKSMSNTWFYDQCLGWKGICVEPSPVLAERLREERGCKVINACVNDVKGEMGLQAKDTRIGNIVPLSQMNANGVKVPCITLESIIKENNLTHINFFSLDVEGKEPNVMFTFPKSSEVRIDGILIENERGAANSMVLKSEVGLMRWPMWNRGYAMYSVYGDDVWVKVTEPEMWRSTIKYAHDNSILNDTAKKYEWFPKFTPEVVKKLLKRSSLPAKGAYAPVRV